MKISGVRMGHYTNLMEENEGPDPELPQSPPQPFTNPEPSKPPMVYFQQFYYLGRWEKYIHHYQFENPDENSLRQKTYVSFYLQVTKLFSRSANSRVPFRWHWEEFWHKSVLNKYTEEFYFYAYFVLVTHNDAVLFCNIFLVLGWLAKEQTATSGHWCAPCFWTHCYCYSLPQRRWGDGQCP